MTCVPDEVLIIEKKCGPGKSLIYPRRNFRTGLLGIIIPWSFDFLSKTLGMSQT
jgi:hypothetical protein